MVPPAPEKTGREARVLLTTRDRGTNLIGELKRKNKGHLIIEIKYSALNEKSLGVKGNILLYATIDNTC